MCLADNVLRKKVKIVLFLCFLLWTSECPADFQVPNIDNTLQCAVDQRCLGFECCVTLDFKITSLMLNSWLIIDPCTFSVIVGFEQVSFNLSLLQYSWDTLERIQVSDFLYLRYLFQTSFLLIPKIIAKMLHKSNPSSFGKRSCNSQEK